MLIIVDRTPKCHPEVAGEGIEYSWARSKLYLHNIPVNKQRSKESFVDYVHLPLLTTKGAKLTNKRINLYKNYS